MAKDKKNVKLPAKAQAGTVYVYCALANGVTFSMTSGEPVTVNGINTARLVQSNGGRDLASGKYGITALPASTWEEIKMRFAKYPPIKNGLIFACEDQNYGNDKAHDLQDLKTGAEQANPEQMAKEAREAGLANNEYVTSATAG